MSTTHPTSTGTTPARDWRSHAACLGVEVVHRAEISAISPNSVPSMMTAPMGGAPFDNFNSGHYSKSKVKGLS